MSGFFVSLFWLARFFHFSLNFRAGGPTGADAASLPLTEFIYYPDKVY